MSSGSCPELKQVWEKQCWFWFFLVQSHQGQHQKSLDVHQSLLQCLRMAMHWLQAITCVVYINAPISVFDLLRHFISKPKCSWAHWLWCSWTLPKMLVNPGCPFCLGERRNALSSEMLMRVMVPLMGSVKEIIQPCYEFVLLVLVPRSHLGLMLLQALPFNKDILQLLDKREATALKWPTLAQKADTTWWSLNWPCELSSPPCGGEGNGQMLGGKAAM